MYRWQIISILSMISDSCPALPIIACLLPERSIQLRGWYGSPVVMALNTVGMCACDQMPRPLSLAIP